MIVKMIILRLLGSSDDKEKIGKVRPEGPPLRGFRLAKDVPRRVAQDVNVEEALEKKP